MRTDTSRPSPAFRLRPLDGVAALISIMCILLSLYRAGLIRTAPTGIIWLDSLLGDGTRTGSSARAVISVEGTQYVYPLSEDRELAFTGATGPATLRIEDGAIFFESSVCRDYTCIQMGKAGPEGTHFIACLPNKIIVTIENGQSEEAPDDDTLDW